MSNIIKSGFVAFSKQNAVVIDSQSYFDDKEQPRIIRDIDDKDDLEDLELEDILGNEAYRDTQFEEKRVMADILVQDAKDQADALLAEARVQAALIMENAKQEGYQIGYNEGRQKAEEEKTLEISKLKASVEEEKEMFMHQIRAEKDIYLQKVEPRMAQLVADLVATLTGVVVEEQIDVIMYVLNRAIRDIEDSKSFIIKVSEEDFELVSARKNELYGANNPGITLEFFADAKLAKGQCIIETDNGMVDCSLDQQLLNLSRDLKVLSSGV